MNLSPAQLDWIDRARGANILDVAQSSPVDAKLRRFGREYVGPCPACGGDDRFAINPKKKGGVFICRGSGGGGVVSMVMHVCAVQFLAACEIINKEPMPAAERHIDPEELARAAEAREIARAERDRARELEENIYRERERAAGYDIWRAHTGPWQGTLVETYLREARLIRHLPETLPLRFAPKLAYFHGKAENEVGKTAPRIIYSGPAMLAPIVDTVGIFRGLHATWLDLTQPNGKAVLIDPDNGKKLESKKVRGSQRGYAIRLVQPAGLIRRMREGEGIETVLSVWCAEHVAGRDLSDCAFWAAINRGNLGGSALATVPHPTDKTATGRAQLIEGPNPDPLDPGIIIPDTVDELVLLGDGDSDRFTTQCALARATARYARPGRRIIGAWAPDGMDFNDMMRGP